MDVSGEARPTKERVEIIGFAWPEEAASTGAQ